MSRVLTFTECVAPFERGCDSAEHFNATRVSLAYTCVIPAQQAQSAMQKLSKRDSPFALPEDLAHIKRIARAATAPAPAVADETPASAPRAAHVELLLCRAPATAAAAAAADAPQELRQQVAAELGFAPLAFHVRRVPAAPITANEWDYANAVWPLSVPRLRTRASDPSLFSQNIRNGVAAAVDLIAASPPETTMTAVVTDLQTGAVVASHTSSIPHGVIDLAECASSVRATSGDAAPAAEAAVRKRFQHPVFEVLRAVSQQRQQQAGYLCNDLGLVASHEPCVMCSMALVHSRIAMAFFLRANTVHGGMGGTHHVNRTPSLNHRFPAYLVTAQE
jgi:tRNA(Arg) A34 adenosine deaminase TadA